MAVIIGKRASHVSAANAMSYVFGYNQLHDGSRAGSCPRQHLLPDEIPRHFARSGPGS